MYLVVNEWRTRTPWNYLFFVFFNFFIRMDCAADLNSILKILFLTTLQVFWISHVSANFIFVSVSRHSLLFCHWNFFSFSWFRLWRRCVVKLWGRRQVLKNSIFFVFDYLFTTVFNILLILFSFVFIRTHFWNRYYFCLKIIEKFLSEAIPYIRSSYFQFHLFF